MVESCLLEQDGARKDVHTAAGDLGPLPRTLPLSCASCGERVSGPPAPPLRPRETLSLSLLNFPPVGGFQGLLE